MRVLEHHALRDALKEPVVGQGQGAARWTQTASDAASGSEGCRVSAAAVNSEHNSRKTCEENAELQRRLLPAKRSWQTLA